MDQISPARGGALLAEPIGQGYGQNNSSSRPAYVSGGSMGAYGGTVTALLNVIFVNVFGNGLHVQ